MKNRIKAIEQRLKIRNKMNEPVYTIIREIINGKIMSRYDKDKENKLFEDFEELKKYYNLQENALYLCICCIKTTEDIKIFDEDKQDRKQKKIRTL